MPVIKLDRKRKQQSIDDDKNKDEPVEEEQVKNPISFRFEEDDNNSTFSGDDDKPENAYNVHH